MQHQLQNKRGKSDISDSRYSRAYPNHNFTAVSSDVPTSATESASNVNTPIDHYNEHDTTMPRTYHEQQIQSQPYNAFAESHSPQCKHRSWGCVCCPSLTYLSSPFDPTSANRNSSSMVPQQPTTTMSYPTYQAARTLRNSPSSIQAYEAFLFVANGLSNPLSQEANGSCVNPRDVASQVSSTPQSHITTPETVFSVAYRDGSRYGSGGLGTSPSTMSMKSRGPLNMDTSSPLEVQTKKYSGLGNGQQADIDTQWLSETNNDNDEWLSKAEEEDAQSQIQEGLDVGARNDIQHGLDSYPYNNNASWSINNGNSGRIVPAFHSSEDQNAPVVTGHYIANRSTLVDLGRETYDTSNTFMGYDGNEVYGGMPHGDDSDVHGTFDFNLPSYNTNHFNAHGTMCDALPSNGHLATDGSVVSYDGASSHSRSRQHGLRDEELDRKLVAWRNAGMSYKEIMAKGNFGLEESTLRGRYRTLTKTKDQRLRKPVWDARAVSSALISFRSHANRPLDISARGRGQSLLSSTRHREADREGAMEESGRMDAQRERMLPVR